jgi:pimeloyl-ACP methyl ester carboxylesterase
MPQHAHDHPTLAFEQAERRLLTACGVQGPGRRVRLADPPVAVRVLEAGDGSPLVLVHGSGMRASTWAPLMPYLGTHRLIAVDLGGFGLSDSFDYSTRPLRAHAVAQITSLLDALGLERIPIVGTSLGGMWALCVALDAPHRITALASLGVPAVALPGMHGDPFFTALSTPGLRQLVARIRSDRDAQPHAAPMRLGRPRPENFLSEAELRQFAVPVLMIWGDEDPYGATEIRRRACALIPDARLEIIPGRHAPFLDDPERCGALINDLVRRAT